MKHSKFKTNELTAAASQDQSQTPQQKYVFSNLPVSGIQRQTEMKHTKFKTNKLTTAAWTKAKNHKTSKKGFMWGGSDGVDHIAREVLQRGVANRDSRVTHALNEEFPTHGTLTRPRPTLFLCRSKAGAAQEGFPKGRRFVEPFAMASVGHSWLS